MANDDPTELTISIDGLPEMRRKLGDAEALRRLKEALQWAADAVDRDMRTGGRFRYETNLATGQEIIHIRTEEEKNR